jgi:hypothetical protein
MLKPFKYALVAIALEVDEEGNPIVEHASQESVFYGKEKLFDAVEEFEKTLTNVQNLPQTRD